MRYGNAEKTVIALSRSVVKDTQSGSSGESPKDLTRPGPGSRSKTILKRLFELWILMNPDPHLLPLQLCFGLLTLLK